jgi:ABC-2 type transport system permease protein
MNFYGVKAIYNFEMSRMRRTLMQSVLSPVISTCLYFVVFGSAIGSRMGNIDNIEYAAYIIPGLVMLSLLMQSISNASFGIYMPKFSGTIYEVLSAPVSYVEIVLGYVGAAATKSVILGLIILLTARLFVDYSVLHPFWQTISLFNPVVYLISGFRWAFYGVSDVHVGISVGMTLLFLAACMAGVWWIFKTGYRLRS